MKATKRPGDGANSLTTRIESEGLMKIKHFRELDVNQNALNAAMEIFEISKRFPNEERFSLTVQIRRSSRSVCTNLSEAWRNRRYAAAFVSKLNETEGEAAETQV